MSTAKKRAPWMRDLPPPAPRRVVYTVLPWRGDGRYRLEQAVKVYRRRGDADRRAAKDEAGTLCVRELDAPDDEVVRQGLR